MRKLVFLLAILALTIGGSMGVLAQDDDGEELPPISEIPSCENLEAVIPEVEEGSTVSFWTLSLSPTFDAYLNAVFDRFEDTYGVEVDWLDIPFAEAQTRLRNALAAGEAPDVVNLSGAWVPEFAEAGQLVNMDEALPQDVIDRYFPGAYEAYAVDGNSYQLPWYLSIEFMLYNQAILEDAGLTEDDLPTTFDELAEVGRTITEETGLSAWAPNLLESDVFLKRLAMEGVPILNDEGEAVFNTPEAVEVLQFYVDMVNEGVIPLDIVNQEHQQMIDRFSAGEMAFVFTGPQLVRIIKENNPNTYDNLGIAPMPTGETGAVDVGVMSLVVNNSTENENAALAMASFVTNPCNMVQFSKIVTIFPSNFEGIEDPYFQENGDTVEESVRVPAAESLPDAEVLLPTLPESPRFLEEVQNAVTRALLGELTAEEALDEAVDIINNEVLAEE